MVASAYLQVVDDLRGAGCVFAEDEAELILASATSDAECEALVRSRINGIPLEVLLGWVDFGGLRLDIVPAVFVPRVRTEFLADLAAELTPRGGAALDLCCGAGAVGAVLVDRVDEVVVHAADIDPAAVTCARRNLPGADVHRGDLFDALPAYLRGTFAVVAANAPYVPTDRIGSMPTEAREYEPPAALDGGLDGLAVQRRIAESVSEWLAPGGYVLIETSRDLAAATVDALRAAGLTDVHVRTCESRSATVVVATRGLHVAHA